MRVCVVGSGGREHALAAVLARTADSVVVAPGNPGIPGSVSTPPEEIDADLYVIGPEAPLVDGLADRLRAKGKLVFGPGADGAQLEGSKAWMKALLVDAGVPTARYGTFTEVKPAIEFLRELDGLYVIKTDGLAAGKGVLVTTDFDEASEDVAEKLSGKAFGEAGRTIVIEEGLSGPELSVLAVCDGSDAVALVPAQDHKRLGDGDTGPNTGGMGAYAPVALAPSSLVDQVLERAVLPTLRTLTKAGIDYRGVLYAGLMLSPQGLKVLEYNVRFGDPEAQVVLPLLSSDLVELLLQAAAGKITDIPTFTQDVAVTVVCAASGYPTNSRVGDRITGIETAEIIEGVNVYCAGVATDASGAFVTAGGRVLGVTGIGATLADARKRAYEGVTCISFDGMQYRHDIALGGLDSLQVQEEKRT